MNPSLTPLTPLMNMNIKHLISVALATVFIAAAADAAPKTDSRKKLEQENRRLQEKLDSLQAELESLRAEAELIDSLEMAVAYGDSVEAETPMEYTVEVTDSLLNIWYAHAMAADDPGFDKDN